MRRNIAAVVLGLLATFLPIAAGTANAAPPVDQAQQTQQVERKLGGWIKHYSPDEGYNTGFYTATNIDQYGRPYCPCFLINEGRDSREYTSDVDAIYVYQGQEIWCLDMGGWVKWFDDPGWYKVYSVFGGICVSRAD